MKLCVDTHSFCIFSLFTWHLRASSACVAADEEAANIGRQHGMSVLDAALISAALAGGKSSICIRSSLYQLRAKSAAFPWVSARIWGQGGGQNHAQSTAGTRSDGGRRRSGRSGFNGGGVMVGDLHRQPPLSRGFQKVGTLLVKSTSNPWQSSAIQLTSAIDVFLSLNQNSLC